MPREPEKCSFCFKSQDQVRLIAGPGVFICEECVDLCAAAFWDQDDPRVHRISRVSEGPPAN